MSAKKNTARASKRIPLTPAELAETRASRIVELRKEIDIRENELSYETAELAKYVEETGTEDFATLKAIKRFGSARLVGEGMTPNEIKYAEEQLMNELPDFVKRSLDTTKMFNAQKTNVGVSNALAAKGLTFEQTSSWTFRTKNAE
ncbi:MAG: hypothetical protein EPGJADBJ_04445 [Saprospiraceae bacterium]|nr:hypothetical protein [Saprospiraceae bacterium]